MRRACRPRSRRRGPARAPSQTTAMSATPNRTPLSALKIIRSFCTRMPALKVSTARFWYSDAALQLAVEQLHGLHAAHGLEEVRLLLRGADDLVERRLPQRAVAKDAQDAVDDRHAADDAPRAASCRGTSSAP